MVGWPFERLSLVSKFLLIFILLMGRGFADELYSPKCKRKKAVSICIVDPKLNWGNKKAHIYHSFCRQKGVKSYYMPNSFDLLDRFDALISQCKTISSIRFIGHAYAGHTDAGGLTLGEMDFLYFGYDELFAPGAKIWITGCNAGRGCLGRVFMYEMARIFLTKGGMVIAPDFYTASPLTGKVDHFSLTGRETVLEYNPFNKKRTEVWRYEGFKRFKWKGKGIVKYCQDEIFELIKAYQLEKTKAFKRGCKIMKIPELEDLRESYLNIHKIFGLLERKRKKRFSKDEKEILDEEYAMSLDSFGQIKTAINYFKNCKK